MDISVESENRRKQMHSGLNYYLVFKRMFDILLSLLTITVFLPLILLITAFMLLSTPKGPVFFKHKRIGQNGAEIMIYKFRTMVPNAEAVIKTFPPELRKEFQENFKLKRDPRITKIGRVLRKTSLDELPQLVNVLKGEMSLVGPRPIVAEELEKYGTHAHAVFSVKPGLTGIWQTRGRSDTTYAERVQMDLEYIAGMSIKTDIQIIFNTFIHVIRCKGAY